MKLTTELIAQTGGTRTGAWRRMLMSLSCIFMLCAVSSFSLFAQSEQIEVKGKVTSQGEPVIGAGVIIKGTTTGSATGIDGTFTLNVPSDAILTVSSIGYSDAEVAVNGRGYIEIEIAPEALALDDVVVVGYGAQKKVNLTAAVGTVSPQELAGKPVNNVVEALQGTIPGLTIQQSSSAPNSRPDIKIRGYNTLNSNEPLILIDGVIGDIQNVNPSDIESISVLKDAAATAIYGSRGANGVLLVTTKRGTEGKASVNYEFRLGWQQATEMPDVVDSWEYCELRNEALVNSGMAPEFTADDIAYYRYGGGPNVGWLSELYKTALQQSHTVSVSGGSEKTQYLVSGGYIDQDSMLKGPDYGMKKFMFRSNVSSQVTKALHIDVRASYTRTGTRDSAYDIPWTIEAATRMPPIYDIVNPDGSYNYPNGLAWNALAHLEVGGYRLVGQDDLNGSITGELKIIDGLKLTGMAAARLATTQTHTNRIAIDNSTDQQNYMAEEYYRELKVTTNLLLEYSKTFAEKHEFSAMAGFTYEGLTDDFNNSSRTRQEATHPYNGDDVYGGWTTGDTETVIGVSGSRNVGEAIYSVIGRLHYNYDERYLVEFNIRNDWSSKFARGYRSALFPSLSAGWRISEEQFFSGVKSYIPNLKLRASWGLVGNNTVSNFQYMATVGTGTGYVFNNTGVTTAGFSTANEALTWETTRMFDVGVDIALLKGNFNLSFDYYNNLTRDILVGTEPVPGIYGSGNSGAPINSGKVRTTGWELSLSYLLTTGKVGHRFIFNLADSKNKILYLPEDKQVWGADPKYINQIGYAMGSYYGYRSDGLFQNNAEVAAGPHTSVPVAPGDVRYIDKDGDNSIDPDTDYYVLGNNKPRYTFGFTYGFNWKGLDFSMFWQGVGQRSAWLRGEAIEAFHNNNNGPVFEFHKDRWTPSNPGASYPRLTVGTASANNVLPSDYWIKNAAYLRLKNVQLGYTFPAKLTKKVKIEQLRIFASMQNVLTISDMMGTGWDPEYVDGTGRQYPVARVMSIGLDLRF